jgi:hypothetical protein
MPSLGLIYTSVRQGWAFGHWTFGQPISAPDKIASARLLVGQTPQKPSDKLGQSDSFGQLGSLSDSSALLGHSDSSDNSDKAEPSFPTMKNEQNPDLKVLQS